MNHHKGALEAEAVHAVDDDGIPVLVVSGDVDAMTEESPLHAALDVVEKHPAGLIVDLRGVTFFGSSGINMLVSVWQRAGSLNVPVAVVATQRAVLRPLEMSGVSSLLVLYPSSRDAVAAISAATRAGSGDDGVGVGKQA